MAPTVPRYRRHRYLKRRDACDQLSPGSLSTGSQQQGKHVISSKGQGGWFSTTGVANAGHGCCVPPGNYDATTCRSCTTVCSRSRASALHISVSSRVTCQPFSLDHKRIPTCCRCCRPPGRRSSRPRGTGSARHDAVCDREPLAHAQRQRYYVHADGERPLVCADCLAPGWHSPVPRWYCLPCTARVPISAKRWVCITRLT